MFVIEQSVSRSGIPRADSCMKMMEWALPPVLAAARKVRSRRPGETETYLFPVPAALDMLELRGIWEAWGDLEMAG